MAGQIFSRGGEIEMGKLLLISATNDGILLEYRYKLLGNDR